MDNPDMFLADYYSECCCGAWEAVCGGLWGRAIGALMDGETCLLPDGPASQRLAAVVLAISAVKYRGKEYPEGALRQASSILQFATDAVDDECLRFAGLLGVCGEVKRKAVRDA